jgi:hypothetical protein
MANGQRRSVPTASATRCLGARPATDPGLGQALHLGLRPLSSLQVLEVLGLTIASGRDPPAASARLVAFLAAAREMARKGMTLRRGDCISPTSTAEARPSTLFVGGAAPEALRP